MALKGWVAARDVAVNNAAGLPLLAWKQARVGLADVQPLAHKLAFDSVSLQGVQWHLDRDAERRDRPAARRRARPRRRAGRGVGGQRAARPRPRAPWDVRVAAIDITDSAILWNDASTRPAAALVLRRPRAARQDAAMARDRAGRLHAGGQRRHARRVGRLRRGARSRSRAARARRTRRSRSRCPDLSLQALAPYIAQGLMPRVDGRLAAKASLTWSGKADAPALQDRGRRGDAGRAARAAGRRRAGRELGSPRR